MLNQFIQLEVDRRGWVVNPAMIAFFKVCKAVMIQGFTEKLKLCDIMSFGPGLALSFVSLTISHSLQVFIALLRKITIRKESGQDSLFHSISNPQQVKAVCSNCS